ncbi:periphilin-1 [Protobothrops mucrosquamatus]|uniref:periphilin-1 n=1 Tax=Protobothrops mucrosquamatus TaxID=103944 RepID=UPI0007758FC9|nr:periphilin-1 [Protobothrops mucrosquamatus]
MGKLFIETSAKQNDTEDSQVCVAPDLDASSLPSALSDIPCVPVLVREKDNELTETSAKQNDTEDCQVYVVPALNSSSLPSSLSDIPCVPVLVREKDNELIETSAKQNDTEDCQVYVVPALNSSSLPSSLSDIRCVPVLVREKDTRWAENQRRWAPEDYQEPPWSVNQTDQCHKVSECYKDSVSTSISSNEKHNVESLIESKSSFQKIHHSTNSKHSSTNQTSRDLHRQSSRSYGRQDCSSRSSGKRDPSTERQDRSSKLSCRREHSSGSSHKQENSPQRKKHKSKTSCRQEQSSQKEDSSPKTSLMQEHGVKAMCKRKRTSRSPPKRKQNSRSEKLDRWKEVGKLGRSCGFHCHCHCQQSCSPSRESLWQRCCSPPRLTCKIKHLHVSREISNVYGMPYHFSPERSIANEKEIRESRQLVEPKIIEKKKKATSKTGRKVLKPSTKKKETTSSCHLNAEEETNSSAASWTPKDRSAAVLARKEELEQAYLQVLLNFGVIAMMLVEKEPCMIEAMSSALRANLRKIGDYYERLLKNYIDSLTEAS